MTEPYLTFDRIQSTLAAMGWQYEVLHVAPECRLIITQYGGRVFGPFFGGLPSLCWINPVWASADRLRAYLDGGGWNLGGDRVWLAPEIQFIIQDRYRFWETHRLPHGIEPGDYTLGRVDPDDLTSAVTLREASLPLTVYNPSAALNNSGEVINVSVDRAINGVSHAVSASGSLSSVWYRQTAVITRDPAASQQPVQAWNLFQLNPGGVLVIPCDAEAVASDYFGSVMTEAHSPRDGAFRIPITGLQQYKTGYNATHVRGRMAYLNHLAGTNQYYLLVRMCALDPAQHYSEEPPEQPGVNGHALHVYHDGGQLGGFGEMEISGYSIPVGASSVTTHFDLMAYLGAEDSLKQIAEELLGLRWDR